MKRMNQTSLTTGLLAGVTAALLSMGASGQSLLAILLYAASALPVLIAGLGWGIGATVTAIITAGVTASVLVSPTFALMIIIITLAPAGWLSHLANLGRPANEIGGPENATAWYPLSDIMTNLATLVTMGMIVVGLLVGYNADLSNQVIDTVMEALKSQDPRYNPDPAVLDKMKSIFTLALPLVQGALWVFLLFAAYYLASRIVQASGKAMRPRDDIPAVLRMNRNSIFVFGAGLVAMFAGGTPAIIGALVCGTFGAGFLLAGFAALHFRLRGKVWRMPVLWLCYMFVALFTVPLFFFLIAGLIDTRRTIAVTQTGKPPKP